jgi:PemK-like, MazF-like toxin of type II toxin-antitoxin system
VAASARVVYTADRLGKGVFESVGWLPRGYSLRDIRRKTTLLKAGEVVVVDFPGATGIKRRPAVVLSSDTYHSSRPDVILGLITSQVTGSMGSTDYALGFRGRFSSSRELFVPPAELVLRSVLV